MALTPRQNKAITALLSGTTIKGAASAASVSEQTLHRWLAESVFAGELARLQETALRHAVGFLKIKATEAAERLATEMASPCPSPGRISAADKLLNHALRLGDAVEMRAKVAALEALVMGNEAHPPGPEAAGTPAGREATGKASAGGKT